MALKIERNAEPLPGYRLIERLGGGGFGEVWKAEAPGGFYKAIKFVHGNMESSSDEDGSRAEQELKAMSRVIQVRHSFILSLDRFDIVDGQLLIVMELADRTLWDRFKECRSNGQLGIPRQELLGYMKESAEALDFMYVQYHLLHLDIKPQNLFLVHNHVKVADFGLVKDLSQNTAASITGGVTPVYAAPETFDGEGRRATDQYSLAIVYQELLTGQRPFAGSTARQLILQHLQAEPNLSSLSPGEQSVLRKALSKHYSDRFDSCQAFVQALEKASRDRPASSAYISPDSPLPDASGSTTGFATSSNAELVSKHGPGFTDGPPGPPAKETGKQAFPGSSFEMVCDLGKDDDASAFMARMARQNDSSAPAPFVRGEDYEELGWRGMMSPSPSSRSTPNQQARQEPPSVSDTGVLRPALILGIGYLGRQFLKHFRRHIQDSFDGVDRLPNIHTLYLDCDEESLDQSTRSGESPLQRCETILTRLHRPSHYLKPKDGKSPYGAWLPSKLLYRIPRQRIPSGVRAFGRLAFVDNYETILRRLDAELKACLNMELLHQAQQNTELGVASLNPRVYLAASLAGGTGSGMFIDAAYAVAALLRQAGIDHPEIVGVLLVPHGRQQSPTALANAYAALTELEHFSRPETTFSACYHSQSKNETNNYFSSSRPPFQRCMLVPVKASKSYASKEPSLNGSCPRGVNAASHLVFTELCTSLGRELEQRRLQWKQGHNCGGSAEERVLYQTANIVRIAWPYKKILHLAANILCQRITQHWMKKDAKALRDSIQQWVREHWAGLNLTPNELIEQLQDRCRKRLEEDPLVLAEAMLDPVLQVMAKVESPENKTGKAAGDAEQPAMPLGQIVEALEQFEHLFGIPEGCQTMGEAPPPGTVILGQTTEALAEESAALGKESETAIAQLVVRLIEHPDFRLAGAEETLRQFSAIVEQTLNNQEELNRELQQRSAALYTRLQVLIENPQQQKEKEGTWKLTFTRRNSSKTNQYSKELIEVLRAYPKCRFQSLVLHQVNSFYLGLRGLLSDQLREVDFCRGRLKDLLDKLKEEEKQVSEKIGSLSAGTDRSLQVLAPQGCSAPQKAAGVFLSKISNEEFSQLDQRIEKMIRKRFRALVHICMSSSRLLVNVLPQMLAVTEQFLRERMQAEDVVQMYLNQFHKKGDGLDKDSRAVCDAFLKVFEAAAPQLIGKSDEDDICLLASPPSESTEQLHQLASRALPRTRLDFAQSAEEIVLYREQLHTSLRELKALNKLPRQAYDQSRYGSQMTPHSRLDIFRWAQLSS